MSNLNLSFVVFLLGVLANSAVFGQNSTQCGDVLRLSRTGQIQYKVGMPYEERERCAWTIRIPDATAIEFELLESGMGPDPLDKITITTFTRDFRPLVASLSVRDVSDGPQTLDGNVAIVVFHTAGSGTGFILNYQAVGTVGSYNISTLSRDYISHELYDGALTHPQSGLYHNEELSTFLIPPPEFLRDYRIIEVTYTRRGLEEGCGSCCDYVEMYTFDPIEAMWIYQGLYCGIRDGVDYHTDLALYLFQSDSATEGNGFYLDFTFPDGALHTTTSTPGPSTTAGPSSTAGPSTTSGVDTTTAGVMTST